MMERVRIKLVKEMETVKLRKSGIKAFGDIPWGTHLCQFYETKENLTDILVPYFAEGLTNNEFCIWVTSPPLEVGEARAALQKKVPELEQYIERGQIEILPYTDWYLLGGKFDLDKVLHLWVERERAALDQGFEGIRFTANTIWFEANFWKSLVNYEAKMNEVIGKHRMIALCTYSLDKCTSRDIVDVIKNHESTLVRKGKSWFRVENVFKRKSTEKELTIRNEIVTAFLSEHGEELYGNVLEIVLKATKSRHGVFGYINENGALICPSLTREVWNECRIPDKKIIFPREQWGGIWGKALIEKRPLYSNTPFSVPEGHISITRALDVPIIYQGNVIGNLMVGNKETDYDERDVRLLQTIADYIAPVLYFRLKSEFQEKERKLAEIALRKGEERYRNLFEDSPISLWEEDFSEVKVYIESIRDSGFKELRTYFVNHPEALARCVSMVRIVDVNKATLDLFQAGNKEELLSGLSQLFDKESYDTFREELITLAEGNTMFEGEGINKLLTGEKIHVSLRLSVAPGHEEKWSKVFVSILDITERKRMEEELKRYSEHLEELVEERTRKLREAERFATIGETAALVGHDLRNPLQAIIGLLYLANKRLDSMSSPENGKQKYNLEELLQTIEKQVDYMNKIVSDLEDYARPLIPQLVETSSRQLINDTLSAITVPEKIKVSIEIEQGFPLLMVDPLMIQRVLTNLIRNALQAMPEGGRLTIRASKNEEAALISVEDTGVGISEENLSKIFQPLFTTKSKGQGLGLPACKQLVEAHGGSITVESRLGRGSTFTVKIPLRGQSELGEKREGLPDRRMIRSPSSKA